MESAHGIWTKVLDCVRRVSVSNSGYSPVFFWFFFFGLIPLRKIGGAPGIIVIVVGNGHGDTSSNPGRG